MSRSEAPGRPVPVLGATAAVVVLLLAVLAGVKSYRDLETARDREQLLQTRIDDTRGRIDHLRSRVERLRSDPVLLERLAREDLGMVRPGDLVIELPVEGAAEVAPPAPPPTLRPAPPPASPAPNPPADAAPNPAMPAAGAPPSAAPSQPAAAPLPGTPAPP